jgi:UDP-N-acetylglucosamine/UDP-N-acetylgalactosamine diphosphorylase
MKRHGVSIPLFIMTGPSTDRPTREYFANNHRLGLKEDELFFFEQGTMPALDATTGRILLESPDRLALSPDGHGGIVAALSRSGAMEKSRSRGIEVFFYAQVDNPLVTACDPTLVGYHLLSRSQMTTQVVRKRFAKERVGNVVQIHSKTHIIEYSDLPDTAAHEINSDGTLKLWAGNIAVHVFDREFLERHATNSEGLPFHRAHKAVPYIDAHGVLQKPAAPNAIKLERFVFDLLPVADRTLVVEGDAAKVFAPVKNADGAATDTPTTSRTAISALHQAWLQEAGVQVTEGVQVEIHPLWAWDAEEVRTKGTGPARIETDTYFV